MFKRIQVSNFKCIDQAQLELKPLTVLCGPNSSGKSSLILTPVRNYPKIDGLKMDMVGIWA